MTPGLHHYLIVSALLFSLGVFGVVSRRSLLVIYMSLELMLNAAPYLRMRRRAQPN